MTTLRKFVSLLALASLLVGSVPLFAFADNPPPLTATFTSTAPNDTGQNPIPVTLTFSEGVTNFTASDLTVGNGSVTNLQSATSSVYTFGIIPAASGSVSVDLNGGLVTGDDGQTNQAATQLQFIYDPNAPDAPATTTATTTATSTPSQTAYLSLDNYSGTPGTAFNAIGSNFDASEVVDIGFAGATTTATADASGGFTTPLTVPAGTASGPASITAIGETSALVATNSFYVEPVSSTTAPVVAEVTPVPTPNDGSAPTYTFSSTEAGNITLGGGCTTNTTSTDGTTTTITLNSLSAGTYDCTLTVTDANGNVSNTLNMTEFVVSAPATTNTTETSGGGGGGGGGMIVGSGPLAPGYVNTDPQPNLVATAAPAPTAVPTSNPQTSSGGGSTNVVTITYPSNGEGSARSAITSGSPAPVALATSSTSTPVTISSTTPGAPNTGANAAQTAAVANSNTSGWIVAGIVVLAIILIGGALFLSRGVN